MMGDLNEERSAAAKAEEAVDIVENRGDHRYGRMCQPSLPSQLAAAQPTVATK